MDSFDYIWRLLNPKPQYYNRLRACYEIWIHYPLDEQRAIYKRINAKLREGKFVNYNPFFAIKENATPSEPIEMSFNEYYKKYETTEEVDGWKMVHLKDEERTIYVKS